MTFGRLFSRRLVRGSLALIMTWVWSGALNHPLIAAPTTTAADLSTADPAQLAVTFDHLLDALEIADRGMPRDRFDPEAIVAKVGRDPAALAKWVRDEIDWAGYQGILRGPTGILMDRIGSNADRAVLLAELLRHAGHADVKLSHAMLDEAAGRDVLKQVRPISKDRLASVGVSDDSAALKPEALAAQAGLDPDWLRGRSDAVTLGANRQMETAIGQATEQSPDLLARITGVAPPAKQAPQDDTLLAAARDYWWVRVRSGESVTNLDPLLADGPPRAALDAEKSLAAADLPPDMYHQVVVQVIVEQCKGGRLQEQTVFSQALRPSEMLGHRVTLSNIPLDWPSDLDPLTADNGITALQETAAKQQRFLPALSVDGKLITQKGFTTSGEVLGPSQMTTFGPAGGAAGGAAKQVGDLLDGPAPVEPAAGDGELTAQWLSFEIRAPGRQAVTVRRQRVDLLGPAARRDPSTAAATLKVDDAQRLKRALALLGETELFLQPCLVPPAYPQHLAARSLLANRAAMSAMMKLLPQVTGAVARGDQKSVSEAVGEMSKQVAALSPGPGSLYDLAAARNLWSPVRGNVYLDQVNILARHTIPGTNVSGEATLLDGFDFVTNVIAVRPEASADAFRIRLTQGVADTAAEAVLADALAAKGVSAGAGANAGALLSKSDGSKPWIAIAPKDVAAVEKLGLPTDVAARVSADVTAGHAVLVPPPGNAKADTLAWWRVDPQTGQTLGIGPNGWGATAAEYAATLRHVFRFANMMFCLGGTISKGVGGAAGAQAALCILGAVGAGLGQAAGGPTGTVISMLGDAAATGRNVVGAASK